MVAARTSIPRRPRKAAAQRRSDVGWSPTRSAAAGRRGEAELRGEPPGAGPRLAAATHSSAAAQQEQQEASKSRRWRRARNRVDVLAAVAARASSVLEVAADAVHVGGRRHPGRRGRRRAWSRVDVLAAVAACIVRSGSRGTRPSGRNSAAAARTSHRLVAAVGSRRGEARWVETLARALVPLQHASRSPAGRTRCRRPAARAAATLRRAWRAAPRSASRRADDKTYPSLDHRRPRRRLSHPWSRIQIRGF